MQIVCGAKVKGRWLHAKSTMGKGVRAVVACCKYLGPRWRGGCMQKASEAKVEGWWLHAKSTWGKG